MYIKKVFARQNHLIFGKLKNHDPYFEAPA